MRKLILLLSLLFAWTPMVSVFAITENWMSQIPNDRIFNQLIIPGTHDSGSYHITAASSFALNPDDPLPQWIEILDDILPNDLVQGIVAGWSKTQPKTISQQLYAGIRYLDCRVGIFPGDNHFYLSHTLLSVRLSDALSQIQQFVAMNPTEIIIVDINHVYNIANSTQQERLISLLQTYLGQYAIPNAFHPADTIGTLRAHGNIILLLDTTQPIYTPAIAQFAAHDLWHQSNINSPWPNASSITALKTTLDAEMAARATTTDSKFFVLQTILSENTDQIIAGIVDPTRNPSIIKKYCMPINDTLSDWLSEYIHSYGANKLNIVIQDWYTNHSSLITLAMNYDSTPQIAENTGNSDQLRSRDITTLKNWWKTQTEARTQ